ncbi:hypothetical protein CASFOL_026575 [Castilleja foliolosa]|uniref:Uncharacterized protein n=1 Tax=Castilleja foliolosa TaxID=1961234 RepID=A0ABD3CHG3_9LAMI
MNAFKTAIQVQFDGIEAQLNGIIGRLDAIDARLDATDTRLDAIDARLDAVEARREADIARSYNLRIDFTMYTEPFYPVVKYIRGHPVQPGLPPNMEHVNFKPEYAVGDLPPIGLVPSNYGDFIDFHCMDFVPMRKRLRAIFWFYNDDRLKLGGNADRATCDNAIHKIKYYLLYSLTHP